MNRTPRSFRLAATLILLATSRTMHAEGEGTFRYSPPEWQSTICLPDDSQKSLVDKSGALLYHYRQGDREFGTRVFVKVTDEAVWKSQQLYSPRVPIVKTCRSAEGLEIIEEAFAVTSLPQPAQRTSASVRMDARATTATADRSGPARNDVILVHIANTSNLAKTVQPTLVVDTTLPFQDRLANQCVVVNNHETVRASLKILRMDSADKSRRLLKLEEVKIEPGHTAEFFALYSGGGRIFPAPTTLEEALRCRDQAVAYWEKAPLPFGRVRVPDEPIQALIDSSIRNIWQAREIKNGLPAFQVGPTCYRGLWIVDGAFLLEAATILGAGDEARAGMDYMLGFQQEDGRFEIIHNYHKENGIVLWACVRHALLTQDKAWLASVWPKLQRTADYIKQLRERTFENDSRLDDGLIPPGFPDGGLGGTRYEYTNVYWNLAGLRAFIQAARWLERGQETARWRQEYDEFMAAFRKATQRDFREDRHGNRYLPIVMGDAGLKELPQRAQWAFCHAVYPGQIFNRNDPLVVGNMAMLQATEQEGMVHGTGWDATGIWNYFASFYGHAWLWQGNGRKAAEVLLAFADHAAPILAWREEQSLRGHQHRKVGDMPHNWASAEFIRLAVHMIALDRGPELHLFEGLPAKWAKPGMLTKLDRIATPFGPLTMELKVADDGKTADLHVERLSDPSCERVLVHFGGWASSDDGAVIELAPNRVHDRSIHIRGS